MKFIIKDFVDMHSVEIEPMRSTGDSLVTIVQHAGSMHFQHTIRPDQARYMAAALQMAADEAENTGENHA